jgi:hypothetical protein
MLDRLLMTEAGDWWLLTGMSKTLKTMTDAFRYPEPSLDLDHYTVPEISTVSATVQNDDAHAFGTDVSKRMPLPLLQAE